MAKNVAPPMRRYGQNAPHLAHHNEGIRAASHLLRSGASACEDVTPMRARRAAPLRQVARAAKSADRRQILAGRQIPNRNLLCPLATAPEKSNGTADPSPHAFWAKALRTDPPLGQS